MLWYIGLAVVVYAFLQLAYWLYINFYRQNDLCKYKRQDTWAIVTGGSDGIGLEFVRRLAHRNYNVLFTGRNLEKLQQIQSRLSGNALKIHLLGEFKNVEFAYIRSDAQDCTKENIDAIVKWAADKDVGVLVNNVGVHQGGPKKTEAIDPPKIVTAVNVNCLYPALLTRALIPALLSRKPTPSLIINVSSVVGASSMVPMMSVYAATKAFNHSFSLAMSAEYFDSNIDILCVTPGLTSSNMTKKRPSLSCSSANECAEGALNKVGLVDALPHYKHGIPWMLMVLGDRVPPVWRALAGNVFAKNVPMPIASDP